MNKPKKILLVSVALYILFVIFTILVKNVDVQAIGPLGSSVGFATLNGAVADMVGVHPAFYHLTKYVGAVLLLWVPIFAGFGIYQWIHRKGIRRVDKELFALGGLYLLIVFFYALFEFVVINYRPVDLGEGLEASYPSTHTMLAITICGSAAIRIAEYHFKNRTARTVLLCIAFLQMGVVVIGRFLSGVHWTTDIIAGIILGCSLLTTYWGMDLYLRNE